MPMRRTSCATSWQPNCTAVFGQDAGPLTYHYGVDVYTSLDPRMQKTAEEAVVEKVEENKARHIDDGALVSIDPQTGLIKAMVGGTDFRRDKFNVVTQGHRQPGSSFKAFDYTTAFLHGYTADHDHLRPSGPLSQSAAAGSGRRKTMTAAIWGRSRSKRRSGCRAMPPRPGSPPMWALNASSISRTAWASSIRWNRCSPPRWARPWWCRLRCARPTVRWPIMGCITRQPGSCASPPPMAMCSTSTGRNRYAPSRPKTADAMKEMMRGVIERGTGTSARCPFPASGKTGTTNSFRDAWFIGYTDDLVTAVWVGNRHNQPMNHTFGATVPAPIWKEYMLVAEPIMVSEHKDALSKLALVNNLPEPTDLDYTYTPHMAKLHGDEPPENLNQPIAKPANALASAQVGQTYTVTICQDTGLRATQWCPNKTVVTYVQRAPPIRPPSIARSIPARRPSRWRKGKRKTG